MNDIKSEYINGIAEELKLLVEQNKNLVIFGAGNYGICVIENLIKFGYRQKIIGICDNDRKKFGKDIYGFKVLSFDNIIDEYRNFDLTFLICSNWHNDIKEQLFKYGKKVCMPPTLGYLHADSMLRNQKIQYEKMDESKFRREINKTLNLLEDEESKDVLESIIGLIVNQDWKYLNKVNISKKQYFLDDFYTLGDNEIYIDLGAASGDTILGFINVVKGKYNKIVAFEPIIDIYNSLVKTVKINKIKNVDLYNLGIWKDKSKLKFISVPYGASHIDDFGKLEVEVDCLDNLLCDLPVTFIKMDIEGSEKEAIIGAQSIIKKYKPKLAICIYHKLEDIYKIPIMIKELVPEYKIYIRHHSRYITDTVCYATI